MKKSLVAIVTITMTLVLSLSALTACGGNKHEFSDEWQRDESYHWHECTKKNHTDTTEKAAHVWDDGVITVPPTEEKDGEKTLTCTECGYKSIRSITKLTHTHKFDNSVWEKDDLNHWHPATCSHSEVQGSPEAHVWDEGVVTTPPTETTEGVKTYTCAKCGHTKTSSIGKTDHEHTFDSAVWATDSDNHWHPATCAHHSERDSLAPHSWNGGVVTTPAGYGTTGEKTFTCSVCSRTKVEPIAALDAKDNAVSIASGVTLDKIYDGKAVVLDPAKINRSGDGAISVMYKLTEADDSAYSVVAPKNAGEYTVKAIVEATAEWKGGSATMDFTIGQRTVELTGSVFDRKFGENLESGKFGLTCIDVAEVTNNVVPWVTICAPEEYYAVGIHTISVRNLFADSDNFAIGTGETTEVKFTVWNAPDSFYSGIKDIFSFSDGRVAVTTTIANGTVNKGDQLLVNEIGKIITVEKIEKGTGSSAIEVDTATAGEEVGLYIEGATKAELERGYMLSKPDTVIGYSKFTATVRLLSREEGGRNTPISSGYNPNAYFADAFDEIKNCNLTFPEGTAILMPGGTLEGVTVDLNGAKNPVFVGRRFVLREGAKTVAECVITALPHATRVACNVSAPAGKTAVVEPIESGEKTFAFNLNRSTAIENLVDSEAIDLVVKYNGVTVGSYKRTGIGVGNGDLAHVENGGTLTGSFINVNFVKNVSGLTDADGKWICDKANVTFDVTATLTQQVDNLAAGSIGTVTIGKDDVKYFTLNELENLPSGWYSFVNAINNNGSTRYKVYTDAGEKVDMMSDMFKSTGGKYYVRYTANANILNAQIGFNAAKPELSATNTTSSLIIPSGKKDDRVVIKVTLNKAVSYFHTNTVTFQGNVPAFNGGVVKVFDSNYLFYNGIGYQSFETGHRFYLPTQNAEQTYAYIMMKYAADLTGTAELKFQHSAAGVQMLNADFQTIPFKANASLNFVFKPSTTGQYKIEIVATGSPTLIPPTTISVHKVYDPKFATVNISDNTKFNATETGYYSLTLKNMTDSEQRVRIHVVKVS